MQSLRLSDPFTARSDDRGSNYATALYTYADSRLDDRSLRLWMTQRLVLDCGLEHAYARIVSDTAIDACRKSHGRWSSLGLHAIRGSATAARRLAA